MTEGTSNTARFYTTVTSLQNAYPISSSVTCRNVFLFIWIQRNNIVNSDKKQTSNYFWCLLLQKIPPGKGDKYEKMVSL